MELLTTEIINGKDGIKETSAVITKTGDRLGTLKAVGLLPIFCQETGFNRSNGVKPHLHGHKIVMQGTIYTMPTFLASNETHQIILFFLPYDGNDSYFVYQEMENT